jgi:hypothetical protein
VEVSGLASVEDVSEAQDAIEEGLEDYFLDREPYITGLAIPPRKDIIANMNAGAVAGQIAASKGGAITDVEISVGGVPITAGVYYLQEGEKAKLGTITWN